MSERVPVFDDDRGRLVAIEFAGLPFAPQRAFTVTGVPGGSTRGGHRASCAEYVVLTGGRAVVRAGEADAPVVTELAVPGSALLIPAGTWIAYDLADEHSSLVVLAERPDPRG